MSKYVDLVLCKTLTGGQDVFQAPAWSHLKEGDMVIASDEDGEVMTNVVASICIGTDSEELDFILKLVNAEDIDELEKVKSKVIYKNLEYKEED